MRLLAAAAAAALIFAASPERGLASPSETSDVACGYSSNSSNVPAGAVGLSRGEGPIKAVLDAVGEYRTHSFIAHGNGWYTHSTMHSPGRPGWPDYCSTPLTPSELQNGNPGASQVNNGGLYMFYYQPEGSAPEAIFYQRTPASGAGNTIQNWLWVSAPYDWVSSLQNGADGLYRVGFSSDNGPGTAYTQYSLYHYRDHQGINTGSGWTYNYGNHCSGYLSYAQNKAGFGVISNSNTYSHTQVVTGINAIYSGVETQCSNSTGFWSDVGAAVTCFEGICDDAARQVTNCFTDGINGRCYTDDDTYYRAVRDNYNPPGPKNSAGYSIAVSVSPDAIGGWGGHAWGSAAPYPVWSWDGNQSVYWNAPGNVYGCFF